MVETRIKPHLQAVAEDARRGGTDAGLPAQPDLWRATGGGGHPGLLALPHQPQVDLSARMVASVTTASSSPLDESRWPLAIILLGPTGSGKTALSMALGEQFSGEIVSCDSVAVYRGMDLGTAKPTAEERARLPHYLIDIADPDQPFTAGAYSRAARAALADIVGRGKLPIVTGGTGLYLRALTDRKSR